MNGAGIVLNKGRLLPRLSYPNWGSLTFAPAPRADVQIGSNPVIAVMPAV
jgi:hypothetical protein